MIHEVTKIWKDDIPTLGAMINSKNEHDPGELVAIKSVVHK